MLILVSHGFIIIEYPAELLQGKFALENMQKTSFAMPHCFTNVTGFAKRYLFHTFYIPASKMM